MEEACLPLKCYSPEFIVQPFLKKDGVQLKLWLKSVYSVVVGPGLGKEYAFEWIQGRDEQTGIDVETVL